MPRGARMLADGSYYHIVTRGNNKKNIFRYKKDYFVFFKIINRFITKHRIEIYHYCLMRNHVHFLIRVLDSEDVPKFFQLILQSYASYFRNKYRHSGFLFQNRYRSFLIDKESYLLECARYIERNPLRAKFVNSLEEYQWSSYLYYGEGRKDKIITGPDPMYVRLAKTDEIRRQIYNEYILQERPYDLIVDKELRIC